MAPLPTARLFFEVYAQIKFRLPNSHIKKLTNFVGPKAQVPG
jgi:hypothetical protein